VILARVSFGRPRCWQCNTILDLVAGRPVGRGETCPECDADLRACRSCASWDTARAQCREPAAAAEVPADPTRANFCSFFRMAAPSTDEAAPAPLDAAAEAKRRLEALFKK